ncbi:MAG TPA: hypothetical protein VFW95_03120 [Candidatus Limnocylindria bacterium]|nr:hypothetical protein [Candidatus Limnocylindria bacterium]
MNLIARFLRWVIARLAAVLVVLAVAQRAWSAWRRSTGGSRRAAERTVLPSLYDLYPQATRATRRPVGVRTVPLDRIVGTTRHPSQNTADFLPLPRLRGRNWEGRWQRINRAMGRLELLPPVDLEQVGDDYYVEDGHNRVAAALRNGGVEIDADVTQLLMPGAQPTERGWTDASSIVGGEELRQAATGRHSRTVEQRQEVDGLSRADLLRHEDPGQ